ncbi:MAG: xanthine dehydrogenase family protein subunit M [Acidobacteria bacterium]|nr:xanthine dehydrogenase family protein subunit M [Acidobacteriota bacterium]
MRSWLAQYEMRSASDLGEALDLLSRWPGEWTPFAGGTDLMVLLEAGKLPRRRFVDLWRINELRGIAASADSVRIGALATYTDLLTDPIIAAEFPLVAAAARETGAVAIQNRGTVGGNIANASPAADLPPALLVYGAALELASSRGRRHVAYESFHFGYKRMDLAADELIVGVTLPRERRAQGERGAGWQHRETYRKVGTRRAQAISKICFAASVDLDGGVVRDIRIALGSVAPTVVRARSAEESVRNQPIGSQTIAAARLALRADISPIDDIRSTADYRLRVAGNLLEELLS